MKEFVLDFLGKACSQAENIVACRPSTNGADMTIDLNSGKRVAVYVINRAIRVPEIQEKYARNTALRLHTLCLIDGRMMPAENAEIDPPHWMTALHALGHGRIYAYWCDRRRITIRPVHLQWRWGGDPRRVEYGPQVDLSQLRAATVEAHSTDISGSFAIADFSDTGFWKKRDPGEGKQFKYSWRQWTYSAPRKPQQERPEGEPSWDAWEAFQRHYGRTGGRGRRYANTAGTGQRRHSPPRVHSPNSRDYQLLGVSVTASFDEVKQAYRQKARENHPDLHPPQDKAKYTSRMADINAAFEKISKNFDP